MREFRKFRNPEPSAAGQAAYLQKPEKPRIDGVLAEIDEAQQPAQKPYKNVLTEIDSIVSQNAQLANKYKQDSGQ